MKKIISVSIILSLILSTGASVGATRMREVEKEKSANSEITETEKKDWGSINYVDNLPGPDFSGYTYGGEAVKVPNYNNYKEFTASDIKSFSDAIVDLKGWDGLIGSLDYDLATDILNFKPIPAATDSNKRVTGYSRRKFGWEDMSFKMKMNDESEKFGGWAGITVLADQTQKVQWTGVQGYLIVLKNNTVELQKYFPTQEMLEIFEHETIKVNQWQNYELKMSEEDNALRIKLIVDGVEIFDYLDKATSAVLKEGYVNFYCGMDSIDLQGTNVTISHDGNSQNGNGESTSATEAELIALKPGNSKAFVQDKTMAIDEEDSKVKPVIENGRTMLPLRFLAEKLGATVTWEEKTRTAKIAKHGVVVSVVPGFGEYTVNDKTYKMDAKAKIENGRILVPVRMISEGLGKKVLWENEIVWVSDEDYTLTDDLRTDVIELLK